MPIRASELIDLAKLRPSKIGSWMRSYELVRSGAVIGYILHSKMRSGIAFLRKALTRRAQRLRGEYFGVLRRSAIRSSRRSASMFSTVAAARKVIEAVIEAHPQMS